jgi:hypothetical protein
LQTTQLSPLAAAIAGYVNRNSPWSPDTPHEVSRANIVDVMVACQRGLRAAICWNPSYNPQYRITVVFSVALLAAYPVILALGTTLDHLGHSGGGTDAVRVLRRHDSDRWLKMAVLNASPASSRQTGHSARRRPVFPVRPRRPLVRRAAGK